MKSCPKCNIGELLLDDEELPPTYFCSNPNCDYEKVSLYYKEEFDFEPPGDDPFGDNEYYYDDEYYDDGEYDDDYYSEKRY